VKPLIKFALLFTALVFYGELVAAQYFASSYKPKNKTEKLIISKIRALPEIKEWYRVAKKSKPDLIINDPDPSSTSSITKYNYSIQVGLSNLDMFRTSYYLYIDPKTFKIYYWDQLDDADDPIITLQQWRYWRKRPEFDKPHKWSNGKLVVLKDDTKKSSKHH